MEIDEPPKRIMLALQATSSVESRAALHWALNSLPIRPGIDYVLLFHVVKCMKVISDGRLGLPYAAASPVLRSSIRQLAMIEGAREMHHYVQVCAQKYVLADVQLSWGDRLPSIVQAVEECRATHLIMGTRKSRGQLKHALKKALLMDPIYITGKTPEVLLLFGPNSEAARCSVYLVNRRAQLETTHVYSGDRGPVGTNPDGSMIEPRGLVLVSRRRVGPPWQHPNDDLTPEAISEREAEAARVQSEVDECRRRWTASQSTTAGSVEPDIWALRLEDQEGLAVGLADGWDCNEDGIPSRFVCCISQEVMVDPVIAADGNSYERVQIAQWLRRKQTSPLTNLPLSDRGLIPNDSLREAITEWKEHRQKGLLSKGG